MLLSFSCKKDEQPKLVVPQSSQASTSAIGEQKAFWPKNMDGSPIVIRIKFIDGGSEYIRNQIVKYAEE